MPQKPLLSTLAAVREMFRKAPREAEITATSVVDNQHQSPLQTPPLETRTAAPAQASGSELQRIADALERIALSLDKLNLSIINSSIANTDSPATNTDNPAAAEETLGEEEVKGYWITLKDIIENQNLQPVMTPSPIGVSQDHQLSGLPDVKAEASTPPGNVKVSPVFPTANLTSPGLATAFNGTETSVLREYLGKRGIVIQASKKSAGLQKQADGIRLEQLALYLGQNFTDCQELYKLVKRHMVAPRSAFSYSLKGFKAEQNKRVRKFCRLLKEAELLEESSYQGTPEYSLQLKATGKEQKYLSGAWLESYVRQEVARIVQLTTIHSGQRYEALSNLEVVFKDNSKAELDLFFAVGQTAICVETKMRPGLAELKTYLNRIKPLALALDTHNLLIVVADKSPEECHKLSLALGNVRIACLTDLEYTLTTMLERR